MKKILFLIVATVVANHLLKSQTTYSATFSDGSEKEITFEYDDPSLISKFRMGVGFFGVDFPRESAVTFILNPVYRVNEKLKLEGLFRFPYSRSSDGNIPNNQIDNKHFKTFKNLRIIAHYDIINKVKTKRKKVPVDWAYDGMMNTVYVISVPRNYYKSLSFDFGLHSNVVSSGLSISPKRNSMLHSVTLTTHRSVSIQAGFSLYKAESYKISTNGQKRSYFRMRRVYANIIYGFVNKADYYQNDTKITDESLLNLPEKKSLGWVVGYSKHFGIINSGLSGWLAIEIGVLPFMANEGYKENVRLSTPSSLLSMHFGLAFGPRPRK